MNNSFDLLRRRRFGPFFLTQFLGAFNDNLFKQALVILIAYQAAAGSDTLVNAAMGLFVLPFFLFSALAGQIADKFEKSRLIRLVKLAEIGVMLAGAAALISGSLPALLAVLFLMGTQSAFFGPVKYGILPQHLGSRELVGGNGLVEMGTFLAILLGTLIGGVMIARWGSPAVGASVIVLALLGWLASRGIPRAEATAPALRLNWNPLVETFDCVRLAAEKRVVLLSVLGISWFWLLGSIYLAQLPNFTRVFLGGDEYVGTLLFATFSVGIGLGSVLCDRLSGHKVELGLVPFGALGLTAFGVDLYFAAPAAPANGALLGVGGYLAAEGSLRVLLDIVALGLFGGFYIVPLYALVQERSRAEVRSRVIAANNILNALFMVAAALLSIAALELAGLSIPQLFLIAAGLNAAVAVYIFGLVPEFLMRFLVWLLISTVYRVRPQGLERVPERGAALLVCNHVSFVDALVIAGMVRRPVRFVMYHKIFQIPVLSFIFRTARAIPIAPAREDAAMLERAYDEIDRALAEGELVCIFPEGQLTSDGEMVPFRGGVERILARRPVPVVPMALRGLWGSFFSRKGGRAFGRWPRGPWSRIGLAVGLPVAPEQASAEALYQRVALLRGEQR